jgi:hypothetical protein
VASSLSKTGMVVLPEPERWVKAKNALIEKKDCFFRTLEKWAILAQQRRKCG